MMPAWFGFRIEFMDVCAIAPRDGDAVLVCDHVNWAAPVDILLLQPAVEVKTKSYRGLVRFMAICESCLIGAVDPLERARNIHRVTGVTITPGLDPRGRGLPAPSLSLPAGNEVKA